MMPRTDYSLSKEDAKEAARQGKTITHRLFTDEEYIIYSKSKDDFEFEDRILVPEIWWDDINFSTGWRIK
jgi:hypothetical protein